jgi:hypothetical protein
MWPRTRSRSTMGAPKAESSNIMSMRWPRRLSRSSSLYKLTSRDGAFWNLRDTGADMSLTISIPATGTVVLSAPPPSSDIVGGSCLHLNQLIPHKTARAMDRTAGQAHSPALVTHPPPFLVCGLAKRHEIIVVLSKHFCKNS